MRTDHPSIPPAAPRHRNPVIAAHYRMAYRFAWQCRGEFLYIHTRPTPFGWVDVTSTSSTLCSPDDLTRAVLDVLERAVAEAPDDERLRADVAVCCTPAGGGGRGPRGGGGVGAIRRPARAGVHHQAPLGIATRRIRRAPPTNPPSSSGLRRVSDEGPALAKPEARNRKNRVKDEAPPLARRRVGSGLSGFWSGSVLACGGGVSFRVVHLRCSVLFVFGVVLFLG